MTRPNDVIAIILLLSLLICIVIAYLLIRAWLDAICDFVNRRARAAAGLANPNDILMQLNADNLHPAPVPASAAVPTPIASASPAASPAVAPAAVVQV